MSVAIPGRQFCWAPRIGIASSPLFRANGARFRFRHSANPTDRKHLPETMGSGVAIVDIDRRRTVGSFLRKWRDRRQGRKTAGSQRLYRNLGNWRFEDVTEKWGTRRGRLRNGRRRRATTTTMDGPDLYVTAVDRNYLYRNTGSKFVEVASRGRCHRIWMVRRRRLPRL